MDTDLLVRLYRVGFGDCIYVQIPDGDSCSSMLIDCGTSAAEAVLKPVITHLVSKLPRDPGNLPRLDLLVVTHPHADHLKGFNPIWFEGVSIGRIWISTFMNPAHPLAKGARALEATADKATRSLLARPGVQLAPGVEALLLRSLSISNTDAFAALREGLPAVHPRLYAARDAAKHLGKKDLKEQALSFKNGLTCFRGFREKGTCLRILAPEWDIDASYLGAARTPAFADPLLGRTAAYAAGPGSWGSPKPSEDEAAPAVPAVPEPTNISAHDFRLLRGRMLYSALAFSQEDNDLKNDTSVVLLLEWRGRRLLFTGDAEWDGTGVQAGQRNCSWDVMLDNPQIAQALLQPVDLFKIAHHGSHNGTPYDLEGNVRILEKIVSPNRTNVVVSTVTGAHGKTNKVPYPPLMAELGRLAANSRCYLNGESELADAPQPQRTDRESDSTLPGVDFIEIPVPPAQPLDEQ